MCLNLYVSVVFGMFRGDLGDFIPKPASHADYAEPRIEWGDFNSTTGYMALGYFRQVRVSGGFFQLEGHFTCSVGLLTDVWIVRGNKVLGRDFFVQLEG